MNQKQMKLCKGYHNLVRDFYNNKIICNNCSLEFHQKNFGTYDVFVLSNKSTLENIICYKYWYEDFNENDSIKINNSHSFEETEDYSICYQGNNVLYKCSNGCGTIKFFMKEFSKWIYYFPQDNINLDGYTIRDFMCDNMLIRTIL